MSFWQDAVYLFAKRGVEAIAVEVRITIALRTICKIPLIVIANILLLILFCNISPNYFLMKLSRIMANIFILNEEQLDRIVKEAQASDINLSSFKVKDELNPKIWYNGKINSKVRIKLLDIVDDFLDDLSMGWVKPDDIVFTGSLANYNWSRYSDIDVHIRFDFKKIYRKTYFIQDYFDSKTEIWKQQHTRLKIYGFPVELKVEDLKGGCSSGEFSLIRNEWIVEPKNFDDIRYNGDYVKRKAASYMTEIDKLEKEYKKLKPGTREALSVSKRLERIYKRMKSDRTNSLKRSGEMSSGNIIYKIIRRTGYLDRLWDIVNKSYDKFRTMKECIVYDS